MPLMAINGGLHYGEEMGERDRGNSRAFTAQGVERARAGRRGEGREVGAWLLGPDGPVGRLGLGFFFFLLLYSI
jgi:hypothetical protein